MPAGSSRTAITIAGTATEVATSRTLTRLRSTRAGKPSTARTVTGPGKHPGLNPPVSIAAEAARLNQLALSNNLST